MTLPKYLNLFQEVRLGAENSLEAELNNESGSRKWVPVDVVGMRLDDVVKLRGKRY
jgi:hypothetical protein